MTRPIALALALLTVLLFLAAPAFAQEPDHTDADCDTVPRESIEPAGDPEWLEGIGENELVLIHGLGGSNAVWDKLVPYLARSFELHLYELHGHGDTPPLKDPTIKTETAALHRWIEENELIYPTLVGHGMGGMIAMQYAFDHPSKVQRLVVIDAGPRQIADLEQKTAVAEALLDNYDKFVASNFVAISRDPKVNELAVDLALRTDSATFTSMLLSSFDWDLTADLPRQSVPMLIVGSEAYLPEAGYEQQYLEDYGFGTARVLSFKRVAQTGHYMMLEKPTYLASVITVWVRQDAYR